MLLLIDNYDSFTYNLVHLFAKFYPNILVKRNDELEVDEAIALKPLAVIISPGPNEPKNAGISKELIAACALNDVPLFGVCLGHQAIAEVYGGKIVRAPYPIHGKVARCRHNGSAQFLQLPTVFNVVRYHSLIVDEKTLPAELEVTARSDDGLIMALRVKNKPIWGVQFHPESVLTEYGDIIVQNFLKIL